MLMDHAEAFANGIGGRANVHLATIDEDPAGVWPDETIRDPHERGLPGAVFPEQAMHCASAD
jgi:hypothetical protein